MSVLSIGRSVTRTDRTARGGAIAVVVGVLLTAGACGGGSSEPAQPAPSPASRVSTTMGADTRKALLDIGQIRLADLGAGWAEASDAKAGFDVNSLADLAAEPACKDLLESFTLLQGSETARSPVFKNEADDKLASNSVTVLDSTDNAAKLVNVLNRVDPNDCLAKVYQKALEAQFTSIINDGSTLTSVRVRRRELTSIGDSKSALEVTLDLTKDGKQRSLVFTRIAVQSGPVVQEFSLRSGGAFNKPETIMEPSVNRVRQCLAKGACSS